MSLHEWHNKFGGRYWRITPRGIETKDKGFFRTKGDPVTMIKLWEDFGEAIQYASAELIVPIDMIIAMIPIEARRTKDGRYDPLSLRKEPGYTSDAATPHRISPGLMQTLITTARAMARQYKLMDPGLVTRELLLDPFYSILLGTAYMHHQMQRYGPDPILITSGYNAGSVRKTSRNPWHLIAYGPTRIDRYAAWFNDFIYAVDNGHIEINRHSILTRDLLDDAAWNIHQGA
jgi:hypothetical protein